MNLFRFQAEIREVIKTNSDYRYGRLIWGEGSFFALKEGTKRIQLERKKKGESKNELIQKIK